MSGYGEPEWVNPQQNSTTVAEADIGNNVIASQADSRCVQIGWKDIQYSQSKTLIRDCQYNIMADSTHENISFLFVRVCLFVLMSL
jgi:hypothetical protein